MPRSKLIIYDARPNNFPEIHDIDYTEQPEMLIDTSMPLGLTECRNLLDVILYRIPSLEPHILHHTSCAIPYANRYMDGNWPELTQLIKDRITRYILELCDGEYLGNLVELREHLERFRSLFVDSSITIKHPRIATHCVINDRDVSIDRISINVDIQITKTDDTLHIVNKRRSYIVAEFIMKQFKWRHATKSIAKAVETLWCYSEPKQIDEAMGGNYYKLVISSGGDFAESVLRLADHIIELAGGRDVWLYVNELDGWRVVEFFFGTEQEVIKAVENATETAKAMWERLK